MSSTQTMEIDLEFNTFRFDPLKNYVELSTDDGVGYVGTQEMSKFQVAQLRDALTWWLEERAKQT